MTHSKSPLNLVLSAPSSAQPLPIGSLPPSADQNSMRLWSLVWKDFSASPFMSLLRQLWPLSVRVIFLLAVVIYVTTSFASDYYYMLGMRQGGVVNFYKAAMLFPLSRDRRSGPGYYTILHGDYDHLEFVRQALRWDPNGADLLLGLVMMRAQHGDNYQDAAMQLIKLVPSVATK